LNLYQWIAIANGVLVLLIITLEFKMDSAEIVYATVDEIIGKTGKTQALTLQAPEEVLHKLRLASLADRTERSSETSRDPSARVTSSPCSSPSAKPEDFDDQNCICMRQALPLTCLCPHQDQNRVSDKPAGRVL
jgi:hypothetical protein